mgnify:CR=1 FL=1
MFKCTYETVVSLYSLFDKLVKEDNIILEDVLNTENPEVVKDFLGDTFIKTSKSNYKIDEDVLKGLNAKGIFDEKTDKFVGDIFMLRELEFGEGYLYEPRDVVRSSNDYGIVGYRKDYANCDNIFAPRYTIPFKDVCEVREEYKGVIDNGYKKTSLPKEFLELSNSEEYKELFKKAISKTYCVNRLFDHNGGIFCGNRVYGYKSLDLLKGVEYDFYNRLLEIVVGLGKPVHSVYFYSDLDWSCMLYRESKESKGEYDIVLK